MYDLNINIKKMPPFVNYNEDNMEQHDLPESALFDQAIDSNDINTIQSMINNGYNVNQPAFIIVDNQERDRYPLIFAVVNGFFDIVDVLLNAGSNINYKDVKGKNSIMYASSLGNDEILQILINDIAENDVANIINERDDHGWTALMIACEEGHHDIVEILLEKGADKYLLNNDNQSASFIANNNGHIDIVNMLN